MLSAFTAPAIHSGARICWIPRSAPNAAKVINTAGAPKSRILVYSTARAATRPSAPIARTQPGIEGQPTAINPAPMPAASRTTAALQRAASATASPSRRRRPQRVPTSVCVAIPRKPNTQNRVDINSAPTPRAASGSAPSPATNPVSTMPVSGSAISEPNRGTASASSVPWGLLLKESDTRSFPFSQPPLQPMNRARADMEK